MALAKPATKPEWTVNNPNFGTVTIEPTAQKKQDGWLADERPPREFMNWLFFNINEWIDYLESISDENAALGSIYDFTVGANPGDDYPDLATALADAAVTAGASILVRSNELLSTTIQVTKNNLHIQFKNGVTFSDNGANDGIQISANDVTLKNARFAGFSSNGILIDNAIDNTRIIENRFANSVANDINDQGNNSLLANNLIEV